MAEVKAKKYPQYPRTNFPEAVDNWDNMVDLNAVTSLLATQYETLIANNNFDAAVTFLESHPELIPCIWNAEKENRQSDAIKALQQFFKDEVQTYINNLSNSTIGINDNVTGEAAKTNTYSASKIDEKLNNQYNKLTKTSPITLAANGWSATAPYTLRVNLSSVKASSSPYICVDQSQTRVKKKPQEKAFGKCVDRAKTYDGYLIFECDEIKPTIDLKLIVKGD